MSEFDPHLRRTFELPAVGEDVHAIRDAGTAPRAGFDGAFGQRPFLAVKLRRAGSEGPALVLAAVVDTGATHCLIPDWAAQHLKVETSGHATVLLDGREERLPTATVTVEVGRFADRVPMRVAIAPRRYAILGWSPFLSTFCTIIFEKSEGSPLAYVHLVPDGPRVAPMLVAAEPPQRWWERLRCRPRTDR